MDTLVIAFRAIIELPSPLQAYRDVYREGNGHFPLSTMQPLRGQY